MELDMVTIQNTYCEALKNEVRDQEASPEVLRGGLYDLGRLFGQEIVTRHFLRRGTVHTPMGIALQGTCFTVVRAVVVSTSDDYESFGRGIADVLPNAKRGQMYFDGIRGPEALTSPVRSISLPDVPDVDTVIIAKSVLATGCTAITLARKAVEKYCPRRLIVATVYYSTSGLIEFCGSLKSAEVFVAGQPENLREDGMLIPGVGNLDSRINGSAQCA